MNEIRNYEFTVDGFYSADLKQAIMDYQYDRGLRTKDGAVGPLETWPRLCKEVRGAIEANLAPTDLTNAYIDAGCNSKGVIYSSGAGHKVACRAGTSVRFTQRTTAVKNFYFTNGVNTSSSYISGYKGKSGPKSSGSSVRILTPTQYPTRGNVIFSYATPPNTFVYYSSTDSANSVYILNSAIPNCYDA